MRISMTNITARLLATAGVTTIGIAALSAPAYARSSSVSVPSMPLAQALKQIGAQSGTKVTYDPDSVVGLQSSPVDGAKDARAAIAQAIEGLDLAISAAPSGGLMVTNGIVVTAHRDEAEIGYAVRQSSSSSRMGQSIREQARNAQIISAKVLSDQQAQTIPDALRNAGGVNVNTATVQGGTTYSVRGFAAGGVVNGLPGASNTANGIAAGSTQSIANVERIEVLKGPDALLAGVDNLGGTINIVTKKPSADPYLYVSAETGSFGHVRGTIDATNALTDDKKLSARIIATAAHDDHNYGGYRGDEDYMFAPSLRYKDSLTDVTLSLTASNQIFGLTAFAPLNPVTNKLFEYPHDKPIISDDQWQQIKSTQFYAEATHKVGDWLTLTARGQHQKTALGINIYQPIALLDPSGLLLIATGQSRQKGTADSVDAFAKINVTTGPVEHTFNAGYTYSRNKLNSFVASKGDMFPYDFVNETYIPDQPVADTNDYDLRTTQQGIYAQYMAEFWKLHLIAGLRHNKFNNTIDRYFNNSSSTEKNSTTTPNFGAVLDISKAVSAFASLAYGYFPNSAVDQDNNKLPNTKSRNMEAGIKADLLDERLFFTGSWFRLKQSNLIVQDPLNYNYSIAIPGQIGTGIDLSLTGEILKGWQVQASYTRTKYKYSNAEISGDTVVAQPRDRYSLYSSYRQKVADNVEAGFGAGIYGRSSAAADYANLYRVPGSRQVDLNGFLKVGKLDVNLGVRNVFDRTNYNTTPTSTFIPIAEPRTWRLTIGYRFQ